MNKGQSGISILMFLSAKETMLFGGRIWFSFFSGLFAPLLIVQVLVFPNPIADISNRNQARVYYNDLPTVANHIDAFGFGHSIVLCTLLHVLLDTDTLGVAVPSLR